MNLFITGLPGGGKSQIARILKEDFGYDVVEVEKILEIETGKKLCTLVKLYGIKQVAKMERRIVDRFSKSCGKIVVGCGLLYEALFFNFYIVYIKIPKERFMDRVNKYLKYNNAEEHYLNFHHYFSNQAGIVVSAEHKTKYEIAMIISDFYKRNVLKCENT